MTDFEIDVDHLLKRARIGLYDAKSRTDLATECAKAATIEAAAQGRSDSEIARALKVNRLTVRRWLGKS